MVKNRHYIPRMYQKFFFRDFNEKTYSYSRDSKKNRTNEGQISSKKFKNTGTQKTNKKSNLALNDKNEDEFTKIQEKNEQQMIKVLEKKSLKKEDYIKAVEVLFYPMHIRSVHLYKRIIYEIRDLEDYYLHCELFKEVYNNLYSNFNKKMNIENRFKNIEIIKFNKPMFLSEIIMFKIDKNLNISKIDEKVLIYDNLAVLIDCFTLLIINNKNKSILMNKKNNKNIIFENISKFILSNFCDFLISSRKKENIMPLMKDKKIDFLVKKIKEPM